MTASKEETTCINVGKVPLLPLFSINGQRIEANHLALRGIHIRRTIIRFNKGQNTKDHRILALTKARTAPRTLTHIEEIE